MIPPSSPGLSCRTPSVRSRLRPAKPGIWRGVKIIAAFSLLFLLGTEVASAFSGFLTTWRGIYPGSSSSGDGVNCAICHQRTSGGNPWNAYGWSVRVAYYAGGRTNITAAILSVAADDADGDGSSNDVEIAANTQPGWTSGNNNTYFFKNNTTTTGNPPVSAGTADPRQVVGWILGRGLRGADALESADPDGDRSTNLEEYLFGGLPDDPKSFPQPKVLLDQVSGASFSIDIRTDDPEFVTTVRASEDLTDVNSVPATSWTDAASVFGPSYVRRKFDNPLDGAPRVFFRAEGATAE